jgi:hypothetical protein
VAVQYHSFVSPSNLPGGDLIAAGLRDLERGDETIAALLVSIGAPRLRRLGFAIKSAFPDPEGRLYALLAASDAPSAHGRFNALVRRLVSFERAAECAS